MAEARRRVARRPAKRARPAASTGPRTARVERRTRETEIVLELDLDVRCNGDLHVDAHHSVEDVGIALGQALKQATGDKRGLVRFGHAYVPLDEALSRVVVDLSGRPGLEFHVPFTRAMIGTFDVDLVHEFFQGFANHGLVTLHVDGLRGQNAHHQAETVFKAFGRALRMAVARDPRAAGVVPSTKGSL